MLRQKELAFIKAISAYHLSRSILNELRLALSRRKKKGSAATYLDLGQKPATIIEIALEQE